MDIYVARQPVLNLKKKTLGYELLFRDGMSNAFPDIDGDIATSKLLSNSFFSIGMEQMTGMKRGWINFPEAMLIKKIPLMFPNDKITVEILEDVKPEKEVIASCRELKEKGYTLALDDFCSQAGMEPLISLADIIKVDFMATSMEEIRSMVRDLSRYKINFLAEKVETYDDFRQAVEMGFSYFQGYFFSKPEIIKGKDITASKLTLLQILAEVNKEAFNFVELEKLISKDVSMSYKLLRYINSAYFRRVKEITSIKHAIVLLGEREVRRFISLIGVTTLADDKPDELVSVSIIRARLCELLAKNSSMKFDMSELFTLGLFSFIDAIMDDHIESLMAKLPLSAGIKNALVKREGPLWDFLALANAYEAGRWEETRRAAERVGVTGEVIPQLYLDAVGWANSLVQLQ